MPKVEENGSVAAEPAKETAPPATKKSKTPERPVVYPEVTVNICSGENAVTVAQMKELLGWQEEQDDVKFGGDYTLIDEYGKKVRCLNNCNNRPFSDSWSRTLAQEVLHSGPGIPKERRRWQFNCETFIVGRNASVISGQHRGIGLVLASQIVEKNPDGMLRAVGKKIKDVWPTPPVLETLVAFGAEETPEVLRSLDNVKPRSLSDVLYTSSLFANVKPANRKVLCTMTDNAVKVLWHRTGAMNNAFASRRTHSEALDFIDRHPKLLRAVKFILEENEPEEKTGEDGKKETGDGRKISKLINAGVASALLFLMGCSDSDQSKYAAKDLPNEKGLDWGKWEKACEFWVLLSNGHASMHEVKLAIADLYNSESGDGGTLAEKTAVICRAWTEWANGGALTPANLRLKRLPADEDGIRKIDVGNFTVGGIDLGNPVDADESDSDDDEGTTTEVEAAEEDAVPTTHEEVLDKAEKVRKESNLQKIKEAKERADARKKKQSVTPPTPTKPDAPKIKPSATAKPASASKDKKGGKLKPMPA